MIFNRVLFRKLLRDLLLQKGAILALILIVSVGVGSYVGMASVFQDMDRSRSRYYTQYRLADFTVDLKRAPEWAVENIKELPNVEAVRGRVNISVMIDMEGRDKPVPGACISMPKERSPVLNDIHLVNGLWFSKWNDNEAILNDAFAKVHGIKPGDHIKVLLLDKQHDLLVIGTAMSPEFVYLLPPGGGLAPDPENFGVMYLSENFLQDSCDLTGAYNQFIGLAYDNSSTTLDNTLRFIEKELDAYGVTNTTPVQEQASVKFLSEELRGIKISTTVMPFLFLGVAALVLNVLLGRLVVQQRPVIGTLKALGYSSWAIMRHYMGFGAAVGCFGGLLGIALGYWIQSALLSVYRGIYSLPLGDARFYPDIYLSGFLISVTFATLGTIKGVRLAARLEPAEAMSPPPPEKGGKILLERIEFFWKPLSFRWKMSLRAIFRNPFRSSVSIIAALVATALIITFLSMADSLDYLMDYEFNKIAHQDLTIALRDPKDSRCPSELKALPRVSGTEPQLSIVCDISNGTYKKRTSITGIEPGNRLYTPLDSAGNPVEIPDEGLIIDRKLSEILNVKPGDKIRLRPLIAERREVYAQVVGIIDTFMGIPAYVNIAYLSRLLGEVWTSNSIFVEAFKGKDERELLNELKKRPCVIGVVRRQRALDQIQETFGKAMGTVINITILFAGLIAFGSVLNAALVSLSERRRDVGSLRVLGYTPAHVAQIFSGESYILNGFGILLGLLAGIGLAHLIALAYNTELYRFPAMVYPWRLAQSAFLMIIFVGLAQIIIHRIIKKMDWLEVLKVKE